MGDRANIYLVDTRDESRGIYLYTHWAGYRWPEALRLALVAGQDRWYDPPYLARIIASNVFSNIHEDTTGGGISTTLGDNEWPIIVCDLVEQKVGFARRGTEDNRLDWQGVMSFQEYVDQTEAGYVDEDL